MTATLVSFGNKNCIIEIKLVMLMRGGGHKHNERKSDGNKTLS